MVDMIEGHPIPQDITGFQFRLIGDMTVKQFAYLAASLVIGWLLFILPFPFILKIAFASIPVLIGLIFAFVPIQGIQADTLIVLFFKALLKPNQYIYEKTGKDFSAISSKQTTQAQEIKEEKEKAEKKPLTQNQPVVLLSSEKPAADSPKPSPPTASAQSTIIQTPSPVSAQNISSPLAQEPAKPAENNELKKQLEDILNQKKQLEQQLQALQKQAPPPIPAQPPQPSPPSDFKKTSDQPKKGIAPFMPDVPNLIAGVIKDPRGNILPNILVEVKDKDDNPVRAFKTNQLGQFASATPLISGTYTVTFEDPKKQQRFDIIDLTAAGEILPPLEITSIDEREELRKSLFTK